ncbi:MAG: MFS transporter, partial [Thermomicrobiales bacterium]
SERVARNGGLSNRVNDSNMKWFALAAACTALFMAILDNLILNVAIPTISDDLNPSTTQLQWIISAYTLVFASLQITAGGLGDRLGRKKLFLFGIAVFTVTSLVAGFVNSTSMLIVARAVMGFGAAFIMPLSLSLVSAAFPPEERGKALGIWSAVSFSGLAFGPMVGGLVVEYLSWHWIFLINVPVGLFAFVLTMSVVRESKDESGTAATDIPGTVLVTGAIAALTWGLIEAGERGWGETLILMSFAVSAVLFVAFVLVELRTEKPMVPMGFFKSRTFTGANLDAFVVSFFISGLAFSMTMYFQNVHGYSPIRAGFTNLPFVLVMMVAAPLSGSLVNRLGSRLLISIGMVIAGISCFLYLRAEPESSFVSILPAMLVMGLGMGLVFAPLTTAVLNSVSSDKGGVASAVNGAIRETGFAFGVALLGTFISRTYRTDFVNDESIQGISASSEESRSLIDMISEQITAAGRLIQDQARFPGLPQDVRNSIEIASSNGFVNGMHLSFIITGTTLIVSAIVSYFLINERVASAHVDETVRSESERYASAD